MNVSGSQRSGTKNREGSRHNEKLTRRYSNSGVPERAKTLRQFAFVQDILWIVIFGDGWRLCLVISDIPCVNALMLFLLQLQTYPNRHQRPVPCQEILGPCVRVASQESNSQHSSAISSFALPRTSGEAHAVETNSPEVISSLSCV